MKIHNVDLQQPKPNKFKMSKRDKFLLALFILFCMIFAAMLGDIIINAQTGLPLTIFCTKKNQVVEGELCITKNNGKG